MPVQVALTPEQLQGLKDLGELHDTILTEIKRASEAGLDMTEYQQKYDQLENLRQGLLKVYGAPSKRKNVS